MIESRKLTSRKCKKRLKEFISAIQGAIKRRHVSGVSIHIQHKEVDPIEKNVLLNFDLPEEENITLEISLYPKKNDDN